MRDKIRWNALVALFLCGMLVPGLSALAADEAPGGAETKAPESEPGVVMPGAAEGFNPKPEPPAPEIEPKLTQPDVKQTPRAMDPGDDEKKPTPQAMDPGDDEKKPTPRAIDPGDDGKMPTP